MASHQIVTRYPTIARNVTGASSNLSTDMIERGIDKLYDRVYDECMKLEVPQVKNRVIPIRLSPDLFKETQLIARQSKGKHSTILRILIEKGIESMKSPQLPNPHPHK